MSDTTALIQTIVDGIQEQVRDVGPRAQKRVALDSLVTEITNLQTMVAVESDPIKALAASAVEKAKTTRDGIVSGALTIEELGGVAGDLDSLQVMLASANAGQALSLAASCAKHLTDLLRVRPDVDAILNDLEALKHLRGGPADTVAFHDFHCLQIAFKSVWEHAFDEKLRATAESLYAQATKLYEDAGLSIPDVGTLDDLDSWKKLTTTLAQVTGQTAPTNAGTPPPFFSSIASAWDDLSDGQRATILSFQEQIDASLASMKFDWAAAAEFQRQAEAMAKSPAGTGGKLARLLKELGQAMSEPYAFDVFAKDSYNYGLLLTYRQEWTPQEYQAGDLRATIPLAPGEVRRYSRKVTIKKTRAQKELEKSLASSSFQTSDTQRAESDVMQKADASTNFKMTADTSFKLGIADVKTTSEFTSHQGAESVTNKKAFREGTVKAAQEYKLERSLEIETTSSFQSESIESGEISNPNNEITVTYLFYELQRRYKINEYLYRVRPVILVAQDVPAPHEIDEAWLIEQRWILSRVLLDDSLRPALDYLSSGFAGDEATVEILRAQWNHMKLVAEKLELQLQDQLDIRNAYRDQVAKVTFEENLAKAVDSNVGAFAKGAEKLFGNITGAQVDALDASRQYAETTLQNINDTVVDLQNKLKQASDAFERATFKYTDAIEKQFSRTVAINQIRIHVKQNILYYMQAIWSHEPSDQRFFRLYNKRVANPSPSENCQVRATGTKAGKGFKLKINMHECVPSISDTLVDLVEIADIDNPLGFKGNYILFPLKAECYLATYLLQSFLDSTYGLKDPDPFSDWKEMGSIDAVAKSVSAQLQAMQEGSDDWNALMARFSDYVNETQGLVDEIVIPTGQLFIEALPGSHPVLEDFKLLHRAEDVRKVKAEVRHAELENLRLASRLAFGQADKTLLEDPDIEKKILVSGDATVVTSDS